MPGRQAPDGTGTERWYYKDRDRNDHIIDVFLDRDGNIASTIDGYTSDATTYRSVFGQPYPIARTHLDPGRAIDQSRLVFDIAMSAVDLPYTAYRAGLWIGGKIFADQLGKEIASAVVTGAGTSTRLFNYGVQGSQGLGSTRSRQLATGLTGVISRASTLERGAYTGWSFDSSVSAIVNSARALVWNTASAFARIGRGDFGHVGFRTVAGGKASPASKALFKANDAVDRTVRRVNPKYKKGQDAYSENCTSCVVAYEFKRRGLPGVPYTASPLEWHLQSSNGGPGGRPLQVLTKLWGKSFTRGDREAVELAFSQPGSRGIIYVERDKGGGGHVFNVENVNGLVRFVDTQPRPLLYDASAEFDRGWTAYLRVDNLPLPTTSAARRFLEEK